MSMERFLNFMDTHKVPILMTSVIVLIVLLVVAAIVITNLASKSGLDNRPRWMMGGLRDDTGSHNAKDVFGMGFGLDQTRKGTQTADGKYKVQMGLASRDLAGKSQTEYGLNLGQ